MRHKSGTKRILFTGGSGKAGKHVIHYLLEQGPKVVNMDLTPLDHPRVDNLTADITQSGEMFNVMTSYRNFGELEPGEQEALFSNRKIREVLGLKENQNWRSYVT